MYRRHPVSKACQRYRSALIINKKWRNKLHSTSRSQVIEHHEIACFIMGCISLFWRWKAWNTHIIMTCLDICISKESQALLNSLRSIPKSSQFLKLNYFRLLYSKGQTWTLLLNLRYVLYRKPVQPSDTRQHLWNVLLSL